MEKWYIYEQKLPLFLQYCFMSYENKDLFLVLQKQNRDEYYSQVLRYVNSQVFYFEHLALKFIEWYAHTKENVFTFVVRFKYPDVSGIKTRLMMFGNEKRFVGYSQTISRSSEGRTVSMTVQIRRDVLKEQILKVVKSTDKSKFNYSLMPEILEKIPPHIKTAINHFVPEIRKLETETETETETPKFEPEIPKKKEKKRDRPLGELFNMFEVNRDLRKMKKSRGNVQKSNRDDSLMYAPELVLLYLVREILSIYPILNDIVRKELLKKKPEEEVKIINVEVTDCIIARDYNLTFQHFGIAGVCKESKFLAEKHLKVKKAELEKLEAERKARESKKEKGELDNSFDSDDVKSTIDDLQKKQSELFDVESLMDSDLQAVPPEILAVRRDIIRQQISYYVEFGFIKDSKTLTLENLNEMLNTIVKLRQETNEEIEKITNESAQLHPGHFPRCEENIYREVMQKMSRRKKNEEMFLDLLLIQERAINSKKEQLIEQAFKVNDFETTEEDTVPNLREKRLKETIAEKDEKLAEQEEELKRQRERIAKLEETLSLGIRNNEDDDNAKTITDKDLKRKKRLGDIAVKKFKEFLLNEKYANVEHGGIRFEKKEKKK